MSDMTGGSTGESAPLTSAEAHVLELVADDYSNSEIAEVLVCSSETVKSHVSHILRKLNVSNRREAARRWRRKITRSG